MGEGDVDEEADDKEQRKGCLGSLRKWRETGTESQESNAVSLLPNSFSIFVPFLCTELNYTSICVPIYLSIYICHSLIFLPRLSLFSPLNILVYLYICFHSFILVFPFIFFLSPYVSSLKVKTNRKRIKIKIHKGCL